MMHNKVNPDHPPPYDSQAQGPCYPPQQPQHAQYGPQPPHYGQQQVQVVYGQAPVQVYQQPMYVQTQPVVIMQPQVNREYTIPDAKGPGIMMILAATVNLMCFILLAVFGQFEAEFMFATVLYLTLGILACVGGFQKQTSGGVATGCLVMACFSVVMSFEQIIARGLGVTAGQILMALGYAGLGEIIYYASIVLLLVALLCMALSIALIVIPSKVVCSCCGAPPRSSGVIISQQTTGNTRVITM